MRCLLPILAIGLSGCAKNADDFPSLLPRAVEGQSLAEPERPVEIAIADSSLDKKIVAITNSLNDVERRFTAAARDAEAKVAVARGVPIGSERWLDAQVALSALDAVRAPVATARADLEQLIIERGAEGKPPYPALQSATSHADAVSAAQSRRIAAFEAALGGA
ncbi:hypothetical protein [Sphingomonas xinjiangensis]|uniref:Uncharacterized protein n=1 Tax=Sphingomonas xinjiangensis TaxID=643568 RepID=A0A840Y756_9SPHN|nr:hypothetical protein [Sphingomonas xinjiangensis]MBB5709127.1 hypothetical protein [Sphingomonas xinjiangensis]